jgi:uncharacterized spore protein YtfJ
MGYSAIGRRSSPSDTDRLEPSRRGNPTSKEEVVETRIDKLVEGHRDAITVKRVFGDPYQKNGITVIPAARVMGGGGGGQGEGPDGTGQGIGTGFGIAAHPVGAYVIRGDIVKWEPAIDVNRIIAGTFAVAALALLVSLRRSE